jgi:hypothetical protein
MLNRLVTYGTSACLLQCLLLWEQRQSWAASPERELPIATIALTVGKEAQDEFIMRLKEFAESSAFATRVVHYGNDKQHYLVEFWRGDVHITASNPFSDIREFSVFIYRTGQTPVPGAHLDALIGNIQGVINEVYSATIDSIKRTNE